MNLTRPIAGAVLALAIGWAGPAAHAADPGGFSARPSDSAPRDNAGTFFRLHVEPGTSRRQSIVVENLSDERKRLMVDSVDGLTGTTSGSVYANRDDATRKAGKWLVLPQKSIVLGPRKTARIPFSVDVPQAARSGDHLAGIALQDAKRSRSNSGSQLTVTQVVRVVVGVQIIVDGPRSPELQIAGVSMKALPGTKVPSVVVRLEHTGTKLCKPLLDVGLTDDTGAQRTVTRQLDTVLPGDTIDYPLPWPVALESGEYELAVQAKECGEPVALQASAELGTTLRGTPDSPEPSEPTVIVKSAVPWPVLVGLLAAVAALTAAIMAFLLRRRQRPQPHTP